MWVSNGLCCSVFQYLKLQGPYCQMWKEATASERSRERGGSCWNGLSTCVSCSHENAEQVHHMTCAVWVRLYADWSAASVVSADGTVRSVGCTRALASPLIGQASSIPFMTGSFGFYTDLSSRQNREFCPRIIELLFFCTRCHRSMIFCLMLSPLCSCCLESPFLPLHDFSRTFFLNPFAAGG